MGAEIAGVSHAPLSRETSAPSRIDVSRVEEFEPSVERQHFEEGGFYQSTVFVGFLGIIRYAYLFLS